MSNTESPTAATGFLAQIDVKYQIEGIAEAQAAHIQAAVAAAIERALPAAIVGAIVDFAPKAYADQVTYRGVVAHDVEEYDVPRRR